MSFESKIRNCFRGEPKHVVDIKIRALLDHIADHLAGVLAAEGHHKLAVNIRVAHSFATLEEFIRSDIAAVEAAVTKHDPGGPSLLGELLRQATRRRKAA